MGCSSFFVNDRVETRESEKIMFMLLFADII